MAKVRDKSSESVTKEANNAYSRRVAKKKYEKENIDFILKVVDKADAKNLKSVEAIRQHVINEGIRTMGYRNFTLDFYTDCGPLCDFEYIIDTHGIELVE